MKKLTCILCASCFLLAGGTALGRGLFNRSRLSNSIGPARSASGTPESAPGAPVLVGPPTDRTIGPNDTALVWESVPGADSYHVQIAIDSAYFTIVVVDTTTGKDTVLALRQLVGTKLRIGGKYFWRVSASNSGGTGMYSAVWSFYPAAIREFVSSTTWLDTDGNRIEAHGGGIMYDDSDGTYYWYGEDRAASSYYAIGVSCYSSKNLYDWKFQGIVLPESATSDSGKTPVLERPKVIYNDSTKKYVMWMHIDSPNYAYAEAGVAVSDSPTGPFKYLGSVRPNNSMSRDMTLFKDTDGKAYLVCSSENNQTTHVCLLTGDYLHPSGTYARVLIGDSREAPAMFKYDSEYFLISSGTTGWAPNEARYATANSPLGPWTMHGNPCTGPNSNITFGGQSTFVLPVQGKPGDFIFMADKWNPGDLPASTYIWLPLTVRNGQVSIPWYTTWDLSIFSTTLGIRTDSGAPPREYSLSQNYPNPFNPTTDINVSLNYPGMMSLTIYNVMGEVVKIVDRGYKPAGNYVYDVDMNDYASGVYFCTLSQGGISITRKMMLLK